MMYMQNMFYCKKIIYNYKKKIYLLKKLLLIYLFIVFFFNFNNYFL